MTRQEAEDIAKEYRQFLRKMKENGLKVEDIPEDFHPDLLALHQHALGVEVLKRREKKP